MKQAHTGDIGPLPHARSNPSAHIAGMAMLLLPMGVAFKNDVEKRCEVIRGQISELVG